MSSVSASIEPITTSTVGHDVDLMVHYSAGHVGSDALLLAAEIRASKQ